MQSIPALLSPVFLLLSIVRVSSRPPASLQPPIDDVTWSPSISGCIHLPHHHQIITDVTDLHSCQSLCVNQHEFICRSVQFAMGECRLSRHGRYTLEDTSQYSQPCIEEGEASRGWVYMERLDLPSWTTPVEGCISCPHAVDPTPVPDLEACRDLCLTEPSICASVQFYNGSCQLLSITKHAFHDITNYTQPCHNQESWLYTELTAPNTCVSQWTRPSLGCIAGYNDRIHTNVSTLEKCRGLCVDESEFICASVEYQEGVCKMSRFSQMTLPDSHDYYQPCYGGGPWLYSERQDTEMWTPHVDACSLEHSQPLLYLNVLDIYKCKELCVSETQIDCMSISYEAVSDGLCYLSESSGNTSGQYRQPCPRKHVLYSHRLGQLPLTDSGNCTLPAPAPPPHDPCPPTSASSPLSISTFSLIILLCTFFYSSMASR